MLAMEWKVLKKEGPGMYEQWFTGETKLQNAFEKVPYSADHFIWTTCIVSDLQWNKYTRTGFLNNSTIDT